MSDEPNQDIPMAECGACEAIIPLDSQSCPICKAVFGDVSDTALGECGACGEIQPADSEKCVSCGVSFVTEAVDSVVPPSAPVAVSSTDEIQETVRESTDENEIKSIDEPVDDIVAENEVITSEANEEIPTGSLGEQESTVEDNLLDTLTDEEDTISEEVPDEDTDTLSGDTQDQSEAVSPEVDIDNSEMDVDGESDAETTADEVESSDEIEGDEDLDSDEEVDDQDIEDGEFEEEPDESEEGSAEEEEIDVEDGKPSIEITDQEVITAFENLALSIASSNMTAAEAFAEIDRNDDGLIDGPEMQKGIENIGGEKLQPTHVKAIMNYLDSDEDNRVDPQELLGALDGLGFGIQAGKMPKPVKVKEFPTPVQKIVMSKSANDIYYPVMYFLFATFIGLWVVNGMGLLVDGTGGTIEYEGHQAEWGFAEEGNWDICETEIENMPDPCAGNVRMGDTYPCDPLLDPKKCENSLTIFSGDNGASSMPAGFYLDGIIMIILGVIGLAGTAYMHLLYAPSLRERAKVLKGDSDIDSKESNSDEDQDEDGEESDEESALDAPVDLVIEDAKDVVSDDDEIEEDDEEVDENTEDDEDSEDDDEDEAEDEVDIGSWVGLDIEGEEYFGEIIEFDDDEGTVTIETEDGEEITAYQDEMFFDDE